MPEPGSTVSSSVASTERPPTSTAPSLPEALRRLEIVELLGGARAAQHVVTVREAAEAGDDVAMLDGVFGVVVVAGAGEQAAAEVLVGQALAVLERHIEERPH